MLLNPDLTKQAQEVIFSRKNIKTDHPIVYFNGAPVGHTTCQKHLVMHLDEKLNFNHHINEKITKANRGIELIRKLAHVLPRQSLITIFKSFIQPRLNYGDINGLVVKVLDSQSRGPIPLGGSKVESAFHPSEVDKMSTRNFWKLSGKK